MIYEDFDMKPENSDHYHPSVPFESPSPLEPADPFEVASPFEQASPMGSGGSGCPGVPAQCEHAKARFRQALDNWQDSTHVELIRSQFGDCVACLEVLKTELYFRHTLQQKGRLTAPTELRINLSNTLGKINLDEISETDL